MGDINYKKAIFTIFLATTYSYLSITFAQDIFSEGFSLFFVFPFLFGISIMIANLSDIGEMKVLKTIIVGLLSAGLLYGGFWIGAVLGNTTDSPHFAMIFVSVINSLLLLKIYSMAIKTVQPTIIHYAVTVSLCVVAAELSMVTGQSIKQEGLELLFLLWTSFFTVALTTALRKSSEHAETKTIS